MKKCISDNSGFSLVEIIVAMGISAFVILAAYMLMNTASTSTSDSTEDIATQQEVMHSMNFLYDKLAESKNFKSYVQSFSGGDDGLVLVVSNTEYDDADIASDITSIFVFNPNADDGALYYLKVNEPYAGLSDSMIDGYVADAQEEIHLLAEDVKEFSVSPSSMLIDTPIKVSVTVEGLKSGIRYSETKTIYSRNFQPTPAPVT